MIRIDAVWRSATPQDLRAGMEALLAQVVRVFGEARPPEAYLFANRRANRIKPRVHAGFGLWLAVRRLQQGHFLGPREAAAPLP